MPDVNRVTLVGTVCDEPKTVMLNGGSAKLGFRVVTKQKREGSQTFSNYHSVVVWGRSAEEISRRVAKGARVYIEGELRTRSYEKDGEKRYVTEVSTFSVEVFGAGEVSPPKQQSLDSTDQRWAPPGASAPPNDDYGPGMTDDEIPF